MNKKYDFISVLNYKFVLFYCLIFLDSVCMVDFYVSTKDGCCWEKWYAHDRKDLIKLK